MGNFLTTLKRFFGNKNTVTILGAVAGIIVLYVGYTWRVNKAINPVSIPYATVEIGSKKMITEDMIKYVKVSNSVVANSPNLITDASKLIGKYVSFGTVIPKNSLFYEEAVVEKKELPDAAFADIPDDETIYSLGVDLHTTYGNSIYPGNYIDLYLKATDENGKIIFGKLIESIKVLAVKDSQGNHLFESTVETRTPSELLFVVPDELYLLLMKAGYIQGDIEIIPVPRNATYSAKPGEMSVASEDIKKFIMDRTADIADEVVIPVPDDDTTEE